MGLWKMILHDLMRGMMDSCAEFAPDCSGGGFVKGGVLWKLLRGHGGNVSAQGIFLDPCTTGGLLGGALRGRT